MAAAVPSIATEGLSTDNSAAPPTPHMLSGRRLSKSVMTADSQNTEASKGWGLVALNDGSGTARAVRVVQKAEAEDFNMIKIGWAFTLPGDNVVQQVELRHGRRSGIRKIYVNKELMDREKSLKNLISDSGGSKTFMIGKQGQEREAEVLIHSKGLTGFTYQLLIDGNPIEQQMTISSSDDPLNGLDIGVRAIQLPKTAEGLGMTLRNNPLGATGVVVWTVEPGKAASKAGVQIGDCVLSIEHHIVNNIDKLVEYVSESVGVVNMELAGNGPSKVLTMEKLLPGGSVEDKVPIGLGLQTTSCGVGILITEIDTGSCAAASALKVGDAILSINDVVPTNPKHAVSLILERKGEPVKFVIVESSETNEAPAYRHR